jgi:hypothetical protein
MRFITLMLAISWLLDIVWISYYFSVWPLYIYLSLSIICELHQYIHLIEMESFAQLHTLRAPGRIYSTRPQFFADFL